ncbi:MAG: carbonic anhydrase [Halobacteriovoraceae bacterium]|nr:carbonic anhydrase [Halobacteriovoraceae bacterium]|tara:strand:+ start:2077 stop:2658 length:582 start_codon:yes stop_codon:yes gene_type:complete
MKAIEGHATFKNNLTSATKEKMEQLKNGQAPETFLITCSDSRICPNAMTNTDFGELFVVRNAGNTLPASGEQSGDADAATLEYAVKALGVKEIVVCGHTKCGAVGALMDGVDSNQLPVISKYLDRLQPLKEKAVEAKMSTDQVIVENIKAQLSNILSYDFVKEKVKAGELSLQGWLYQIEDGDVKVVEEINSL